MATKEGTLYEVLSGSDTYVRYLATNSEGKIVAELATGPNKGSVRTYTKSKLREVVPFTFDVRWTTGSPAVYGFFGKEGEVKVGDVLVRTDHAGYQNDMNLCRVVKINSRRKEANRTFKGINLSKIARETDALVGEETEETED